MKDLEALNKDLRTQAINNGLCFQWQNEWTGAEDKDALVQKYVKGLDFCIQHEYPSLDYIRKNFEDEVLNRNGVWVDDNPILKRPLPLHIVLLGACRGFLTFSGFDTCAVYVRHDTKVTINIDGYARIFVFVYDNAQVTINNRSHSVQSAYTYSDNCAITYDGDVRVTERDFNKVYKI